MVATFYCGEYIVENILKRSEFSLFLLLALFVLGAATGVQADDSSQRASQTSDRVTTKKIPEKTTQINNVSYDKVSDHLSVMTEAASLKLVLGRVAQLSGIEVLFDDQADEPLTINI